VIVSLDSVLRTCSDVRFRRVGDESVAVKQHAGEVMVLNGVGGRILELVDGKHALSELLATLERDYDVDRDTLTREVLAFAAELREAGLVEPAGDGTRDA